MKLRAITRAVVFDPQNQKLLLARNRGAEFWYPPGGGWEFDRETIVEGAVREVLEETGLSVTIIRMLYAQQFKVDADTMYLELFWLAHPMGADREVSHHKDLHGSVEEVRWFAKDELAPETIYPERLKGSFWELLDDFCDAEDPFIHAG